MAIGGLAQHKSMVHNLLKNAESIRRGEISVGILKRTRTRNYLEDVQRSETAQCFCPAF